MLRDETIVGFNSFVKSQKKAPGQALLTLVQFDDKYQIYYAGVDIKEVKPLNKDSYVPRGYTALYDAVGKTIVAVGERLSNLEEGKRPGQVIFLVITDGEENYSKEYRLGALKTMIETQTQVYSWSFIFMGGGDIRAQKEQGVSMGFDPNNTYGYQATSDGTEDLYSTVSQGVIRRRVSPVGCGSFLSDEEREKLEKSK